LQTLEINSKREIVFYQCLSENLKLEVKTSETQIEQHKQQVQGALSKVKQRLLHMRKEREAMQSMLSASNQDKEILTSQKQKLESDCEDLRAQITNLRDHLEQNILASTQQTNETDSSTKSFLKTIELLERDKKKLTNILGLIKNKFLIYKKKVSDEQAVSKKEVFELK